MPIQLTELHFRDRPDRDHAAIKARVQQILGCDVDAPTLDQNKGAFLIFHRYHTVQYSDGQIPAQTAILETDRAPEFDRYASDIEQSWNCPDADNLLRESKHTMLVNEFMTRGLPAQDRLRLFHGVLQAVIEVTEPHALVFKHSQQVVAPPTYLDACGEQPILRPGSLNVRFFNVSNSPDDMIMDTRGLDEIGLHDLQCHFRNLDPNDVCRVLYNTAVYIVENGPVIEPGQSVTGAHPESMWQCQFENSLLEPKRELLDLESW